MEWRSTSEMETPAHDISQPDADFLEQLYCPLHNDSPLQQTEEALHCSECNATFPIVTGIPRFVEQEHLASFGLQWNKYEVAHDEEDQKTFTAKTGTPLEKLKGLRILDAGCGGGRYCKVAGEAGATVIGADHSSAVEKAAKLCAHLPAVNFLQGDLKQLPLEKYSFDFAFSIGSDAPRCRYTHSL